MGKGQYRKDFIPVNEEIRADKVRLIDQDGRQVGVVDFAFALRKAEEAGLDLVAVGLNADPIVCKIMDYGKFRYEKQKKEQKSKKSQHSIKVKELKLRPMIAENDYKTKIEKARGFLRERNRVKFNIFLRGREAVKKDMLEELVRRLKEDLKDVGAIDGKPDLQGRRMVVVFESTVK